MQNAMFFCEECGAANIDQASYCFACYTPLSSSKSQISSPMASSSPVTFTQVPVGNGAVALKLAEPGSPVLSNSQQIAGPLPAGSRLARRYRIIETVGHGGFGLVYKAKDEERHNKLVAIKQINLDKLSARDMIQATDSYNREVKLLPPLRHKNLPRFHAHFTDPGHWYLVMDFIDGETLEEYLKRVPGGKLPMRDVMTIGTQLCLVLRYLHKKHGIIFRDVKPSNVMRTRHGHLYLIDFGIARRYIPGQSKDTMPLGSPGYAAPEQYGLTQSSVQTDIYGLGATLQTLLTGMDAADAEQDPLSSEPIVLPGKVQALLDQMLARDPRKRPKNMEVVRRKLLLVRDGVFARFIFASLTFLAGVFAGSLPYLLSQSSFNLVYVQGFVCLIPLLWVGELITGIVYLNTAGKRLFGLGMVLMLVFMVIVSISIFFLRITHPYPYR